MIARPAEIPPLPDRQPEYSNVNKVCNIPFQTNTEQIQQAARLPSPCEIQLTSCKCLAAYTRFKIPVWKTILSGEDIGSIEEDNGTRTVLMA